MGAPEPLPAGRLEEIRARAEAAFPGPWRWRGNTESRHLRLQSPHRGGMTVMDFVRWGMQGARPRFGIEGLMYPADKMVGYEVPHRSDVVTVDHPDAEFIAHAREDVPALLAELARLREAGVPELLREVVKLRAKRGRLRAAWRSARRRAARMRKRIAALEAERHTTNEALDDINAACRAAEAELAATRRAKAENDERFQLEAGAQRERAEKAEQRVAELEAAQADPRRAGYAAAIEVMRQERLPMSVGLLEAQLELDALDAKAADAIKPACGHGPADQCEDCGKCLCHVCPGCKVCACECDCPKGGAS